jgi:hypothetical protein
MSLATAIVISAALHGLSRHAHVHMGSDTFGRRIFVSPLLLPSKAYGAALLIKAQPAICFFYRQEELNKINTWPMAYVGRFQVVFRSLWFL